VIVVSDSKGNLQISKHDLFHEKPHKIRQKSIPNKLSKTAYNR